MSLDPQQAEIEVLRKGGQILSDALINEFVSQGHKLTGGWENSLKYHIISTANETCATGEANFYGSILSAGVNPDRIPYGGPSTGATTSKYIQGLIAYWKLRGLNDKEAIRDAFATAKNHKKEGLPSSGSYRFSETGQRTQFIEIVDAKVSYELNEAISEGLDEIIDALFHETKSETI